MQVLATPVDVNGAWGKINYPASPPQSQFDNMVEKEIEMDKGSNLENPKAKSKTLPPLKQHQTPVALRVQDEVRASSESVAAA